MERPALAPPNWVFGPVWTALFALIGVALWLVWRRAESSPREVSLAVAVFAVHFAFNLGWSAVFFGLQAIGLGLGVILVLWVLIGATMWAFGRVVGGLARCSFRISCGLRLPRISTTGSGC